METITDDLVQKVFNQTIYPNLKEYVESNSKYAPLITKSKPAINNRFPIVPIKLLPSTNTYNNLSYGDEIFSFGFEIDINTQNKNVDGVVVDKRTICEEITSLFIKYLKEHYRVTLYIEPNATITDENVQRALIRVSGFLDTRNGLNNLVIYPR